MVPALAFEASSRLPFGFFYMTPLVTDCESICDRSVGYVSVVEDEQKVSRSLIGRSSVDGLGPFC